MTLQDKKEYRQPVTALFFGSFNPIHNGHVGIARYLLDNGLCDELWFVVSPCNPFKVDRFLLPEEKRLKIVEKAVEHDLRMAACNAEFAMPKPSYTANTLRLLLDNYPDRKFILVIGEDNAETFPKWKDYPWILDHCPVFIYPRSGKQGAAKLLPGMNRIDAPLFPFSATEIREMISRGEIVSGWVPEQAWPLIKEFYGNNL